MFGHIPAMVSSLVSSAIRLILLIIEFRSLKNIPTVVRSDANIAKAVSENEKKCDLDVCLYVHNG